MVKDSSKIIINRAFKKTNNIVGKGFRHVGLNSTTFISSLYRNENIHAKCKVKTPSWLNDLCTLNSIKAAVDISVEVS